jgi:hypothetical protein
MPIGGQPSCSVKGDKGNSARGISRHNPVCSGVLAVQVRRR